ncbi:probable histone-lysine N-methyltransferase CG1716 [Drosophila busckii]|uniref:probable histone-lysine N-methyltransferase CG1716 n=1 Tax=Drosophila busckii TaxID=30019 RepID=UPI00083F3B1F|nr:probable histone-lysine N-methyltransferase CG1716 [Drosophila busckii]
MEQQLTNETVNSTSPLTAQPRKRVGRPPKVVNVIDPAALITFTEESTEAPADDDFDTTLEERVLTVSPTLSECRRSSRKKIIKFDVRDLLNKNRKNNKIQIEARIDSNTTLTTFTDDELVTAATIIGPPLSFVHSPFNGSTLPSLEVFAKPKPTQNLIITHASGEEPRPSGSAEAPRKRGRPRKLQPQAQVATEATCSFSYSDSDTNSSNSNTNSSESKSKSKLRVALKRMSMPNSSESSDSGESLKGQTPLTLSPMLEEEVQHTEMSLPAQDDDSNQSQIIFVEIETAKQELDTEPESETEASNNFKVHFEQHQVQEEEQEVQLEPEEVPEPESDIIVEVWSELELEQSEKHQSDELVVEEQEELSSESTPSRCSSARRSTRSALLASDGSEQKKTLEETFAEIAAASSKQATADLVEEQQQQQQQEETLEDDDLGALITLLEDSTSNPASSDCLEEQVVEIEREVELTEEEDEEEQQRPAETPQLELVRREVVTPEQETQEQEEEQPVVVKAEQPKVVKAEQPEVVQQDQLDVLQEEELEVVQEEVVIEMETTVPLVVTPEPEPGAERLITPTNSLEAPSPIEEVIIAQEAATIEATDTTDDSKCSLEIKLETIDSTETTDECKSSLEIKVETIDATETTDECKSSLEMKAEVAPKSQSLSIVECDALFKALDQASVQQLRQDEKQQKKKVKSKKPAAPSPSPAPPAAQLTLQSSDEPRRKKTKSKRGNGNGKSSSKPEPVLSREDSLDSSSSGSKRKELTELESRESPPDPLKDIAKFIEDGVKLLERDYKPEEEEEQQQQQQSAQLAAESEGDSQQEEFAQRVANLETPASTPATTPASTPATTPASSPLPILEDSGSSTGVRRSHRIKQKPQVLRPSVYRQSLEIKPATPTVPIVRISLEEQLSELAHIETINDQFLRNEGLNTFQSLRDNFYRCARQVSQENAEMQCDCEEAHGQFCCGAGCINRMLMIECGPLCSNGQRCTNKRFQQHHCWPCRVFRTEKKGCGITAELQIPAGEFIMEYVGEVIDNAEFERRQHLYSRDRNRHYYFMALRGEAIIDATAKGNISRYINHSCDPNAETQKWTVNGELRIGFFSVKTILPGEEITFDYQYQRYGRDAQRCYCDATNCRGWIGGEPDSDEGEQIIAESESEFDQEDQELELLEQQQLELEKSKSKRGSKSKLKFKLSSTARKRKEKAKDREYKAGRWLRPTNSACLHIPPLSSLPPKPMLEDPDVLEQLKLLNRSELKNQADTLRFSRCLVRAKLLQTRLQLLGVLTRGELPCRRLFLDYHGLRLLQAWISESGSDLKLRLALLEALESLPIPNRTMLNDSRVYQSVQDWCREADEDEDDAMQERLLALLAKWQALPEIFRIPKRERIEQMKEHEREANEPQPAGEREHVTPPSSADRYRQDRFRRDFISSRYDNKSKPSSSRMSGNNTICSISGGGSSSLGKDYNSRDYKERYSGSSSDVDSRRRFINKELRRSLFARKVAKDEAEKRSCLMSFRERELRCEYFGYELTTDPKMLPLYQNTETLDWFNHEDMLVPPPPRVGVYPQPPSPEQPESFEYRLPLSVKPLPPSWQWSMTATGDIYYYSLRDRIPQWEPPNAEQRSQPLIDHSSPVPPPAVLIDTDQLASELISIDIDYVGNLSSRSLAQFAEAKIRERREMRRSRLVSICVISPRREEDRVYNQMESRKYKENKEKIRRRKEKYRRQRIDTTATPAAAGAETSTAEDNKATPHSTNDVLPIHSYLYSSDEDENAEPAASKLPVADADGDGDKDAKVDETDADSDKPSSSSGETTDEAAAGSSSDADAVAKLLLGVKRKLPQLIAASEAAPQKKHRSDKKRKTLLISTPGGREAIEKFRFEISGHVADYLRPYRKDNCQMGRITNDEDYKFLIKRLSHHITTKEMRYCDVTGNPLACTESVKHKSFDFINQYMRKKGRVYKKPADEAEY